MEKAVLQWKEPDAVKRAAVRQAMSYYQPALLRGGFCAVVILCLFYWAQRRCWPELEIQWLSGLAGMAGIYAVSWAAVYTVKLGRMRYYLSDKAYWSGKKTKKIMLRQVAGFTLRTHQQTPSCRHVVLCYAEIEPQILLLKWLAGKGYERESRVQTAEFPLPADEGLSKNIMTHLGDRIPFDGAEKSECFQKANMETGEPELPFKAALVLNAGLLYHALLLGSWVPFMMREGLDPLAAFYAVMFPTVLFGPGLLFGFMLFRRDVFGKPHLRRAMLWYNIAAAFLIFPAAFFWLFLEQWLSLKGSSF